MDGTFSSRGVAVLAMRRHRGMGWVWSELLWVCGLLALAMTFAARSASALHTQFKARSLLQLLAQDLRRAREEAGVRGRWVLVCRQSECAVAAREVRGRPDSGWAAGWRMVIDLDGDGRQGDGEPVLADRLPGPWTQGLGAALVDRRTAGFRYQFNPMGIGVSAASRLGWTLQDGTPPAGLSAQVCVAMSGRPRPC